MARRYTPEQHAWMEARWRSMTSRELMAAWRDEFGSDISETAVHSYGSNRRWRKDPGVRSRSLRGYTDEEEAFVREFTPGHPEAEIIEAFEERFGRRLTTAQIGNLKQKLGVRSGTVGGRFEKGGVPATKGKTWADFGTPEGHERSRRGLFKKGGLPHNTRPLLDERVGKDGYVQVHVGQRSMGRRNDQWMSKAQFVWEQANGMEWPGGCRSVFVDGDRLNFDPANIVPVPMDLYPIIVGAVKGGLEWHDRGSLEAAMTMARVIRARRRLETCPSR